MSFCSLCGRMFSTIFPAGPSSFVDRIVPFGKTRHMVLSGRRTQRPVPHRCEWQNCLDFESALVNDRDRRRGRSLTTIGNSCRAASDIRSAERDLGVGSFSYGRTGGRRVSRCILWHGILLTDLDRRFKVSSGGIIERVLSQLASCDDVTFLRVLLDLPPTAKARDSFE